MATFYRPQIRPGDYLAFATIAGIGPLDWNAEDERLKLRLRKAGHESLPVAVRPAHFLAYCRERQIRADRDSLYAFAQYIGCAQLQTAGSMPSTTNKSEGTN